mgnify:FL=1
MSGSKEMGSLRGRRAGLGGGEEGLDGSRGAAGRAALGGGGAARSVVMIGAEGVGRGLRAMCGVGGCGECVVEISSTRAASEGRLRCR